MKKLARCSLSFKRRPTAESSRSSLAAKCSPLWGICFPLVALESSSSSFCIGHQLHQRKMLEMHPLCPYRRHRTARAVREKRSSRQKAQSPALHPRMLTSKISKAQSAAAILELVDTEVDGQIFNEYHMSAAFTRLSKFSRRRMLTAADACSSAWPRLMARLRSMLREDALSVRCFANVFWAFAELYGKVEACDAILLEELGGHVQLKAFAMNAQDLANCLLVAAKLNDEVKEVLSCVQCIAERIHHKAKDMKPQELSNCLWAAATLKDVAPQVLAAVPATIEWIPLQADAMKPQELSNALWAAAKLQDSAPEVLTAVPAIARRIPHEAKGMIPQGLSNILWASAKLQDAAPDVVIAVPTIALCIPDMVKDMTPQHLSNSLWGAAKLQDVVPEVLVALQPLVTQISARLANMPTYELRTFLFATSELGEDHLESQIKRELARRKR